MCFSLLSIWPLSAYKGKALFFVKPRDTKSSTSSNSLIKNIEYLQGAAMDSLKCPDHLRTPQLTDNARLVLARRYRKINPDTGEQESEEHLFWRTSATIAAAEEAYPSSPWKAADLALRFYDLLTEGKFLPNSPTLMNAGLPLGQLAACFVLPIGDSIEEIFDAVKYAAMIHKSGGGTGFSFSRLRPKGSRVGTTGGVASGPVSFLRIFNTATEQIKQGGTRRGANMGILRVDHPDIVEFIRAKEKEGEFNNFNLSVGLTEAFMQAVERDENYELTDPHTGKVTGSLRAREIFDLLVCRAWQTGDPGIVFLDRINRDNPTPAQGEIESTNPCGEQPLLPYEACNLGSINLASFFVPGHEHDEDPAAAGIDWDGLKQVVHLAVRFLDNVIDASRFPLERIDETNRYVENVEANPAATECKYHLLTGIPYTVKATSTEEVKIMDDEGSTLAQGTDIEFDYTPVRMNECLTVSSRDTTTVAITYLWGDFGHYEVRLDMPECFNISMTETVKSCTHRMMVDYAMYAILKDQYAEKAKEYAAAFTGEQEALRGALRSRVRYRRPFAGDWS